MNPKRFLQVVAGNALALSALYLATDASPYLSTANANG